MSTSKNDRVFLNAAGEDEGQPLRAPYWPEPAVTDAQGRFRIEGFSETAQAEITMVHNDYVHEVLTISTADDLSDWHKKWGIKPASPRFAHVLEPARPIEGVVTDRGTGRPIVGANIEMFVARPPDWRFRFRATTDAEGRYRIIGVAWNRPGDLVTNVTPSAASGYLPVQEIRGEWPPVVKELRWNFTLKKGRLVRGKVIDAGTRRSITGAKVTGEYNSPTVVTDAQGNFALSIDSRLRSLFVEGPTPDYQRVTVKRGELGSTDETLYPHGFVRIDDSKSEAVPLVEIALKKGATISAQAVDPGSKSLMDVVISGRSLYAALDQTGQTARLYSNGLFRMSSFVPGQSYRIFFIQNERHLAGFTDLTAGFSVVEPTKVTLRPTASVRGKLLRSDGMPDRRKSITVQILMATDNVKLDPKVFFGDQVLSYGLATQRIFHSGTDDNGDFEIAELIADVTHYLCVLVSSNRVEYYPVKPLHPSEVRDLGEIKPLVLTDQ